jgi:hypothetical protein
VTTGSEHRESLEQLIAAEIRENISKYAGRPYTPQLRAGAQNSLRKLLAKYRDAGVPVHSIRGLMEVKSGRFVVKIITNQPIVTRDKPCEVIDLAHWR